ncbi:MAG: type II secretion system F family protein [Deltaproteobacteria bacterium]|nr:type II secretion system F family protein [Deltaproteobacteria bacterium]
MSLVHCILIFVLASALCFSLTFAITLLLRMSIQSSLRQFSGGLAFHLQGLREVFIYTSLGAILVSIFFVAICAKRPVFGLAIVFLVPVLASPFARKWKTYRTYCLDRSALSFFYALQGLIRSGISLPTALFELSKSLPSPFATQMNIFLKHYQDGKVLSDCMQGLKLKGNLKLSGLVLSTIQMAYVRGLSFGPFLDRMLPTLRSEQEAEEKERSLRRSVWMQMMVALLVPWFIGASLYFFQAEAFTHLLTGRTFFLLLLPAVTFQLAGLLIIQRVCRFC